MNHTFFLYSKLLLLSISGSFILSTFSAFDPLTASHILEGQTRWFLNTTAVFALCTLLSDLTSGKPNFRLSLPDIGILFLFFTLLLTGDRTREKMIFLSTAVCLWVMLRSILKEYPPLRMLFLMIAIYTGVTQSIWGSMQLYGLVPAEHIFIKLTGLSIDPVQLSGYTIVITPIVFGMLLKLHNCNKSAWWQVRTAIYYFPGSVSFLF
ncbi:MAG: hypothetical protein LIP06_03485 [Tannerellaceae bacterium]|nr:hypothetical protein [Tannerellaceae bacterium]